MSKPKNIKLKVTPREFDVITLALMEYGQICDSEADLPDGTQSQTTGLAVSKDLIKINDKLFKQRRDQT